MRIVNGIRRNWIASQSRGSSTPLQQSRLRKYLLSDCPAPYTKSDPEPSPVSLYRYSQSMARFIAGPVSCPYMDAYFSGPGTVEEYKHLLNYCKLPTTAPRSYISTVNFFETDSIKPHVHLVHCQNLRYLEDVFRGLAREYLFSSVQ